ncbi:GMC family oxidoreductase [Marinimicrococcus flavescens]|uniref:GMC family oxidoreductase n=1 Tax=Marinimicrococcus flavescens TaxID=3031815 RepID=A0AAP3V2L1_9PROT|nr:GMC family oxidoreductase [Marinimicrococcus flavescens]
MSLLDASSLAHGAVIDTDVAIIGAGAAGITLARALAAAGCEVVLAEAGGLEPDPATQALHDLESVGYPPRPDYMARARYYGGTCNLWAGRSMRLLPVDFAARPWIPWSGWPVAPEEIAAFEPEAASILGLPPGGFRGSAALEAGMSAAERALLEGGELAPTLSLWAPRPRRFGAAFRRELARSPRVRLLLGANATGIALDATGRRAVAVRLACLDGRRLELRARRIVLACGGLENARLLLASREQDPAGIGNAHGHVGRFFMDHPRTVHGKVHLEAGARLRLLRGVPVRGGKIQLGLAPSPALQEREGLLHHYVTFESEQSGYAQQQYDTAVQIAKVVLRRGHAGSRLALGEALHRRTGTQGLMYLLSPKEIMPHWAWRALWHARRLVPRKAGPQRYVAVYFCEQPPDPESRVYLSGEHDALGVPRLVLDWRLAPAVTGSVLRLERILDGVLRRQGLGRVEPGQGMPHYTDASHHMGTTRMSADPRLGVVDTDCRVHGLGNLYMAGSSVFPCAGHANPTLTIVALALRLARHLATHRG